MSRSTAGMMAMMVAAPASDAELYRAWADGDRRAGAELIDRHIATVNRFFANKTGAAGEAEDLVAMTFERCAKSLGRFRGDSSFRSYLLAIALNVLRDELRKHQPQRAFETSSIADLSPTPSRVVADRQEQRLLLAGLRAIPLEYQLALELSFFEDLSRQETADILGIPPGTVASRIRRGRELLCKAIARLTSDSTLLTVTVTGLATWARGLREHLRAPGG
jgi:RNA polymerase sigma factor (sigma-70 family)